MQLVTCHSGRLYRQNAVEAPAAKSGVATGLAAMDALMPGGVLARGSVHELLFEKRYRPPDSVALLMAKAAWERAEKGRVVAWCDADGTIYPPALAARGLDLDRLLLVRPAAAAELLWCAAECMACRGVAATVASLGTLSRVQARRLQLAAERGGGIGVLLRPAGKESAQYAAVTRWLVTPLPGERIVQRWRLQLIHGHGGQVGQSVILEHSREQENPVRAFAELADRPAETRARAIG